MNQHVPKDESFDVLMKLAAVGSGSQGSFRIPPLPRVLLFLQCGDSISSGCHVFGGSSQFGRQGNVDLPVTGARVLVGLGRTGRPMEGRRSWSNFTFQLCFVVHNSRQKDKVFEVDPHEVPFRFA